MNELAVCSDGMTEAQPRSFRGEAKMDEKSFLSVLFLRKCGNTTLKSPKKKKQAFKVNNRSGTKISASNAGQCELTRKSKLMTFGRDLQLPECVVH